MAIWVKEGVESSRMEMDGGLDSIIESLWVIVISKSNVCVCDIVLQIKNLRGTLK